MTDEEALDRYRERTPAARNAHPLVPLAFQGVHEVLEGEPVDGIAIANFPSMPAARAWYASPEKLLQPTALSTPVIRCSTSSLVAAHAGTVWSKRSCQAMRLGNSSNGAPVRLYCEKGAAMSISARVRKRPEGSNALARTQVSILFSLK